MVSENRVIFMAPDSFAAIYSKKASRFNISKLFPQKQPYVKNAILNDLLHKTFLCLSLNCIIWHYILIYLFIH